LKPLEMYEVLKRFDFRCSLTGSENYHIEHWLPRAKGGETDVRNVYPLDADLNLKKGKQNPFLFFEREDIRQQIDQDKYNELVLWLAIVNDMSVEEFRRYTFEQYENFKGGSDNV
jgi:hypothetical protein